MFVFSTCQVGAESVLKQEFVRLLPGVRSAFARPGFVSFKTETPIPEKLTSRLIFARTVVDSLGKVETDSCGQLVVSVWKIVAEHHLFVNRVHVFGRHFSQDVHHEAQSVVSSGTGGEPHFPPELIDIHRHIVEQTPQKKFLGTGANDLFQPARSGETVLDVVMIEPNLFFAGTHAITATSPVHVRYSGGILPISLPTETVSRAYLKFNEGFLWSGIVFDNEDKCLDIGASPGGCSQFLLQQGVRVFGVDPGAIHPIVLTHPRFTHVRSRIKDAKRSLLRDVKWITADMNVAPNYTLDVLEDIVSKTPSVQGMLFTLKLIRWELAGKLPMFLDRIRTWGFSDVRAKQLVFNRQEVMVIAKE